MGWSVEDAELFRRYELDISQDVCDYCGEVADDFDTVQVSTSSHDYFVHPACVQSMAEQCVSSGYRRVFAFSDGLKDGTFIVYTSEVTG